MENNTYDLITIGAGPAALTTAIYAARENLSTLLFEKALVGGMAATVDKIENYPGYAEGISGMDFAKELRKQAERFGAKIEFGAVHKIERDDKGLKLSTDDGDFHAKSVLIATGCDHKVLGIKGESEYFSRGVHYCATCDGVFYTGKRLVVVGGGNSAVQGAIFLSKFATHIDLLVRSKLRASQVLQDRLAKMDKKISVHMGTTPEEITGDGTKVTGVKTATQGKVQEIETDGVFVFAGITPNTQFLKDSPIELDESGYIKSDRNLATSLDGVFVAGDVRSGAIAQIASATGDGAVAALSIRDYMGELDARRQ